MGALHHAVSPPPNLLKPLTFKGLRLQYFLHSFLHFVPPVDMNDRKHLKLRHNTWYFQKRVPKALKPLYPDTDIIEKSLETGDIREARQRRDIILGQLRQREHLLRRENEPRRKFLQYVDELRQVARDRYVGPDVEWNEVLHPENVNKVDDPEYVEAYKTVTQGKTDSEKYGVTLKETLVHFINTSERDQLHTVDTRSRFKKTVKLFLFFLNQEDIRLSEISRNDVFRYIEHCREKQSGATVHGHISRLKMIWKYGYERAWVKGDNPFESHRINTTKGREKKEPLTSDELKRLLEAMRDQGESMKLLTMMCLYTGSRIGDIASIRNERVFYEDDVLMMDLAVSGSGKTEAATRRIPVPRKCVDRVLRMKEESEAAGSTFLFYELVSINSRGRLAYKATKIFSAIKRRHVSDKRSKGSHSFRVMMATALQRANVSELEAAYLLGHSRKGLTMSYGYYSKGYDAKRLQKAQDRAIAVIDEMLGKESGSAPNLAHHAEAV